MGAGKRLTEVRLDGWYEGGLEQPMDDGAGCATRLEVVESPIAYVDD